jgi:pimeloyl-ACP methyl ester carboxylesterase
MPYAHLEEYEATAQYSLIAGHHIAHWQAGEGEVILFVHGFPSAAWDWHSLWQPLSQSHRVIALDLLGYGLSDKPHPHQYSLLEQADIIDKLLLEKKVTQCHVIAHDYGNSVTQELLSRCFTGNSELSLASITFLNGGLFSESHRPLLTQKLLKSWFGPALGPLFTKKGLHKSFKRIFGTKTPPKDQEIDAIWSLLSRKQGKRVIPALLKYIDERQTHRDRWLLAMQQTATPLQFINGIEDPISGLHMLTRYRELIPNPQTHQLPLGHYPQLEGPEDVLSLVNPFLLKASLTGETI